MRPRARRGFLMSWLIVGIAFFWAFFLQQRFAKRTLRKQEPRIIGKAQHEARPQLNFGLPLMCATAVSAVPGARQISANRLPLSTPAFGAGFLNIRRRIRSFAAGLAM